MLLFKRLAVSDYCWIRFIFTQLTRQGCD